MNEGGKSRSILITPNRQYFLFSADQVINIVFWINIDAFRDHEALLILCIRCNWDPNRKKWEEPSQKAERRWSPVPQCHLRAHHGWLWRVFYFIHCVPWHSLAPFLTLLLPFIYRIVIGNLFNINLYHPKKGEMVIDIILPEKRFKI